MKKKQKSKEQALPHKYPRRGDVSQNVIVEYRRRRPPLESSAPAGERTGG